MVYSAVREPPPPAEGPSHRAEVTTRAVVTVDDRRYVLDAERSTSAARATPTASCATPTSPATTPSCAAPRAASGRSPTSARPTGSRSTAAASARPGSNRAIRSPSERRPSVSTSSSERPAPMSGPGVAARTQVNPWWFHWYDDPYLSLRACRREVRLPRRPLPVPALDCAQRAQGPARHGRAGARRDRLPSRCPPSRAPRRAATPGWSRCAAAACARASAST